MITGVQGEKEESGICTIHQQPAPERHQTWLQTQGRIPEFFEELHALVSHQVVQEPLEAPGLKASSQRLPFSLGMSAVQGHRAQGRQLEVTRNCCSLGSCRAVQGASCRTLPHLFFTESKPYVPAEL